MKIQVTEEDIKNGIPMDPCSCPVALALKRVLGYEVSVDTFSICPKTWYRQETICPTPSSVKDFISLFDYDSSRATPFEFEIPDPKEEI